MGVGGHYAWKAVVMINGKTNGYCHSLIYSFYCVYTCVVRRIFEDQ